MRNKRFLPLIIAIIAALSVMIFASTGLADAGNFAGDTDFGGGWDSGSDWGSDSDWDSDWDSDYSGGSYFLGGGSSLGGFVSVAVVILVIYLIFKSYNNKSVKKATEKHQQQGNQQTFSSPRAYPLEKLIEKDPLFSAEAFTEHAANIYVQMQGYWQSKNWEPMRQYMTDSLFNQFGRQLDELKRLGRTNYIERIAVLEATIYSYGQDEKNDIIIMKLRSRIVDYTKDDASGAIVSGDMKKEKFMEYEYTFVRSKGVQTQKQDEKTQIHCPSCGAAMDINNSGKCPYCGAVTQASQYDWVITSIKGISQRTA